jgi:hypothetical protein
VERDWSAVCPGESVAVAGFVAETGFGAGAWVLEVGAAAGPDEDAFSHIAGVESVLASKLSSKMVKYDGEEAVCMSKEGVCVC